MMSFFAGGAQSLREPYIYSIGVFNISLERLCRKVFIDMQNKKKYTLLTWRYTMLAIMFALLIIDSMLAGVFLGLVFILPELLSILIPGLVLMFLFVVLWIIVIMRILRKQ